MKTLKKIVIFFGVIIAIVLSITLTDAATATVTVTMTEGTGSGYIMSANNLDDVLGYTPGFTVTNPYDINEDGVYHQGILRVNGKPVYCIQPGILVSLQELTYVTSQYSDKEKNERMAWISYFGYMSPEKGNTDPSWYDATQQLIWQTVYPGLNVTWFTDPNNKYASDTNNVSGKVDQINKWITEATTTVNLTAPTNVMVGDTKTFTGDFSNYTVKLSSTTDATIVSQNNQGLKVKFNTTNPVTITVTKKFANSNTENNLVYQSETNQNFISLGLKIPTISKSVTVTANGGNLEITKKSSSAGSFLGDTTLQGAVYSVKYSGTAAYADFDLVTDANGVATTKGTKHDGNLPTGTYTIKEKTPSKGYTLDTNTYTVTISSTNYGTVQKITTVEPIIQSKVQIVKVEASDKTGVLTPEANKVFKLYFLYGDNQKKEVATLTTDADGYAVTSFMPYGVYSLEQVEPYGTSEPIKPIEITIDEDTNGKTLKYVLANAPYSAKVMVIKKDKDTDKVIEVAGVKFKIKWLEDENGNEINEYVTQTITLATGKKKKIEYFVTDEDGTFITPESLRPGKYRLEEIEPAPGYELTEETITFEIMPSAEGIEIDEDYGLLKTIEFYNKAEVPEENEPNPPTFDNMIYITLATLIIASLGAVAYRKIKN